MSKLNFFEIVSSDKIRAWGAVHAGCSYVITHDEAHGFAASTKDEEYQTRHLGKNFPSFSDARLACERVANGEAA